MAEVYGVGLYILFLISVTVGLILYLCLYLGLSEATRAKLTVSLGDKESLSSRSNSTEPSIYEPTYSSQMRSNMGIGIYDYHAKSTDNSSRTSSSDSTLSSVSSIRTDYS